MPTPLSQKTLQKKYESIGLSQKQVDLLHKYFLCFCNLYGVISIKDAWDIFKHYEEIAIHKSEFVAFAEIIKREAELPYAIFEIDEIYKKEPNNPLDRMIINKSLILHGGIKFLHVYALINHQMTKQHYLPDKVTFDTFVEDRFYLTPSGKAMKSFIENLKINNINKSTTGNTNDEPTDINGKSIKGQRLGECIFHTMFEKSTLGYYKSEYKKQSLLKFYNLTASEKLLNLIKRDLMVGEIFNYQFQSNSLTLLIDELEKTYYVKMNETQCFRLFQLFMNLNNNSNLWLNRGWAPDELSATSKQQFPSIIKIGPNMKKSFENGEMDRDEFEKEMSKMGFTIID